MFPLSFQQPFPLCLIQPKVFVSLRYASHLYLVWSFSASLLLVTLSWAHKTFPWTARRQRKETKRIWVAKRIWPPSLSGWNQSGELSQPPEILSAGKQLHVRNWDNYLLPRSETTTTTTTTKRVEKKTLRKLACNFYNLQKVIPSFHLILADGIRHGFC